MESEATLEATDADAEAEAADTAADAVAEAEPDATDATVDAVAVAEAELDAADPAADAVAEAKPDATDATVSAELATTSTPASVFLIFTTCMENRSRPRLCPAGANPKSTPAASHSL